MLTVPPGAPPCSVENEFLLTWNSWTDSWLMAERTLPVLRTLATPSIMKVLPRPFVPPMPRPEVGVGTIRRSVALAT